MKTRFYIYIALVLVVSSCKTTAHLPKQNEKKSPITIMLDSIRKVEPGFKNASVKMNVSLNYNNRSFSSAAQCKIIRDSAIFISMQPVMGLELFKMEITPEKILIFDKFNLNYYETDFSFVQSKLGDGMNFESLQALISNRYFTLMNKDSVSSACRISDKNTIVCQNALLKQETMVDNTFRVGSVTVEYPAKSRKLTVQYSEFGQAGDILFPYLIKLEATQPGNLLKADFKCSKISFPETLELTPTSVSQYSKQDIKKLLSK